MVSLKIVPGGENTQFSFASDKTVLMCPTFARRTTMNSYRGSCPSGSRLLKGSEIETTYFGAMPMTLKRQGKSVVGTAMSLMNVLSRKYDFTYSTQPSRAPNTLIENVRSDSTSENIS